MKGADYKEVIAFMDEKEDGHKANPFLNMTKPSKEHIVSDENEQVETGETDKTEKTEE
jgi:hypothetical protein